MVKVAIGFTFISQRNISQTNDRIYWFSTKCNIKSKSLPQGKDHKQRNHDKKINMYARPKIQSKKTNKVLLDIVVGESSMF